MYDRVDLSVHSVAFSIDDFGLIPIYDVFEREREREREIA